MRINSRKIRKFLVRFWTATKRIFLKPFALKKHQDASAWMQHSQLFIWFRKSNKDFSYAIFPVKKIIVGKILKLWENCYLIILSIHILKLEISGCDNSTPLKVISSGDSRKASKKQRLMWVLSKAYQLSSYQPSLHKHTKHALLFFIAHWTCIGIYSLVPLITYPFFYHCDFSTLRFAPS
jgi:hypothetical protein